MALSSVPKRTSRRHNMDVRYTRKQNFEPSAPQVRTQVYFLAPVSGTASNTIEPCENFFYGTAAALGFDKISFNT
jgi:hypothetical protein